MIQDLLDSITFHAGERLPLRLDEFDIQEVAKEVCDQFTAMDGARFQLIGGRVRGWWDRDAMRRAMENLIGNAVKYGTPGTPIRIKIGTVADRMMLSVHSEGEPIPPEEIESVFQVFQRAAAAKDGGKEGWGIGLPYVRSVAESHGGSVEVDSALGRGTTFLIDIPKDARPFQDAPTLSTKLG
jgi:signal transduction histidine kinase